MSEAKPEAEAVGDDTTAAEAGEDASVEDGSRSGEAEPVEAVFPSVECIPDDEREKLTEAALEVLADVDAR